METIDLLKEQLEKLEQLKTPDEVCDWREETLPIISTIFPEKTSQYKQFVNVGWGSWDGYTVNDIKSFKNCLNGLMISLKIPSNTINNKTSSSGVHIVNNNHPEFVQKQSQNQNLSVDIKDILNDEIPSSEMREIESIVKTDGPKETKLQKIGEVLNKTGIGVLSSTLAKIITSSMGIF